MPRLIVNADDELLARVADSDTATIERIRNVCTVILQRRRQVSPSAPKKKAKDQEATIAPAATPKKTRKPRAAASVPQAVAAANPEEVLG